MEQNYFENLFDLRDKVVFLTGATGQLGYEITKNLVKAGCYVVGADSCLNETKQISSSYCEYINLDVREKDAVAQVIEGIFKKYGSVDILINNAGVSCFEPFEDRPEDSFDWVMDVNLKGTFFCIQSYINCIKNKQKKGNIVNIASLYGVISPDFRIYTDCDRKNSEVYGATKAGIIQMTRYFAVHLAQYGITVNSISPGGLYNPDSPQGNDFIKNYIFRCPLGRMAESEDIIGGILFLSSKAASYITGQNITIDGGFSCW